MAFTTKKHEQLNQSCETGAGMIGPALTASCTRHLLLCFELYLFEAIALGGTSSCGLFLCTWPPYHTFTFRVAVARWLSSCSSYTSQAITHRREHARKYWAIPHAAPQLHSASAEYPMPCILSWSHPLVAKYAAQATSIAMKAPSPEERPVDPFDSKPSQLPHEYTRI